MSKEHWSKKLKRELAQARADVRELVLRPDSMRSMVLRCREQVKVDIAHTAMAGTQSGDMAMGGIFCKMVSAPAVDEKQWKEHGYKLPEK